MNARALVFDFDGLLLETEGPSWSMVSRLVEDFVGLHLSNKRDSYRRVVPSRMWWEMGVA